MVRESDSAAPTPADLARAIKAEARALGFDLVGIASAEPFVAAEGRALAWLARGDAAGMAWITAERIRRSCHPDELLPGAQSFIAVGIGYRPADERGPLTPPAPGGTPPPGPLPGEGRDRQGGALTPLPPSPSAREGGEDEGRHRAWSSSRPRAGEGPGVGSAPLSPGGRGAGGEGDATPGTVARYARGRDYHDLLKPRLWALVRFLEARLGRSVAARVFVDDGPCPDRAVAQRAGLGFFGKNTNLLTRTHGSYVLLGAALTDVVLPPDPPAVGDCGSCTLCLDACPSGALPAAYRVDSRRCISYLTIEQRGALPEPLRAVVGEHLFGCDVCQEVCPWNRLAAPTREPAFAPEAGAGAVLDAAEILALDEAGYRTRLRGSPLKRAKRQGLRRNAALVLGNGGGAGARAALQAAASDNDLVVGEHARWALGRLIAGDEEPASGDD